LEELLDLLKDGHARTIEGLAMELHTDTDDVGRKLEFLEMQGIIKKVISSANGCNGCSGCAGGAAAHAGASTHAGECSCGGGASTCKGCMPEGGFQNMGQMWEVVV